MSCSPTKSATNKWLTGTDYIRLVSRIFFY
jgi:hypothetical protein